MTSVPNKIGLSASRDIPFNKLLLSQSNVGRVKAGVSVEELAEDVARHGLLQGLSVRAVLNANGDETGTFEIPAGGRRHRALELLVRQKRLATTAPVRCIVRDTGIAEEGSLAENIQRAPLHPLDQFRAFQTLRERGQAEEEIAAVFFVSPTVVRQRLRLASVGIVDDALWERIKAKQADVRTQMGHDENGFALNRAHRAQHLQSGLILVAPAARPSPCGRLRASPARIFVRKELARTA